MLTALTRARLVIALCMLFFAVTSCAFAPSFKPTTMEGAVCKKECAQQQQSCRASSYTCDQGYASCLEACIDIDRMSNKGK
jgi:hypothetical protein